MQSLIVKLKAWTSWFGLSPVELHTVIIDSLDYLTSSVELALDGMSSRNCTDITIIDDEITEITEDFVVSLTEEDPRVEVDRDQATVQITDNDGIAITREIF